MISKTFIYRKNHMEVKVDDPSWVVRAIMFLKGYEIKSVVEWGMK